MCQVCEEINQLMEVKKDVDFILNELGIIQKADENDPFNLASLLQFEIDFAEELKENAKGVHEEAVLNLFELIESTNLDRLEQSQSALDDFQGSIQSITDDLGNKVTEANLPVIESWIEDIYQKTKNRLADDLDITRQFTITDRNAVGHLNKFQNFWLKNHYSDDLANEAKEIVLKHGLESGLGRSEVAEILKDELGDKYQDYQYWDTVASTWLNNSRTYSSLNAMSQAGIAEYIYRSVLDERTTVICESLEGTTFSVEYGLELWNEIGELDDPKEMRNINPMVNTKLNSEGNVDHYYYKQTDGSKVTMSPNNLTRGYLESHGVVFPPVHFL